MSITIEIVSTEFKTRAGTSARTGNAYSMREQIAYLHKSGEPYPEKIKINLEENCPPYRVGNYDLSPSSFYVDKYDSIAVRPILVPRAVDHSVVNTNPNLNVSKATLKEPLDLTMAPDIDTNKLPSGVKKF